ncbi:MAG: glycosyltransferase, partial [Ancalomicrobiaceae bacterium]|nr:glycosyltransferase [Ancalomicrobiaceae bacterium]
MSNTRRLRVLSIAHPAVLRAVGRRRYHFLGSRSDLDVHLLVPRRWHQFGRWMDADPPDDPGVTVHIEPIWLPRAPLASWYLHVYPGLDRLIDAVRPDLIHLWEEPWSLVAWQAMLSRRNAPMVLEVDQNILKPLIFPFEQIRRFVLRRTDHILARSPDADAVVRACGFAGESSLIAYGVDQETFFPKPSSGADRSGLSLGYVGRLVVEKGLDDAIEALAACPRQVTLSIMGEGPHEAALRAKAESLGLGGRVTFQGWGNAK